MEVEVADCALMALRRGEQDAHQEAASGLNRVNPGAEPAGAEPAGDEPAGPDAAGPDAAGMFRVDLAHP